jgi:hypothetical protein
VSAAKLTRNSPLIFLKVKMRLLSLLAGLFFCFGTFASALELSISTGSVFSSQQNANSTLPSPSEPVPFEQSSSEQEADSEIFEQATLVSSFFRFDGPACLSSLWQTSLDRWKDDFYPALDPRPPRS